VRKARQPLFVLEKGMKARARHSLHDSQSGLPKVLWRRNLGSGHRSGEMRLKGRMSCAKYAFLFRFRPAHRATNRQYMPQRELVSFRVHNCSASPDRLAANLLS
jgi:hypothetical protein